MIQLRAITQVCCDICKQKIKDDTFFVFTKGSISNVAFCNKCANEIHGELASLIKIKSYKGSTENISGNVYGSP
jgi:hypothetical protein